MSNYRDQLESWLGNLEVDCNRVADVGGGALPVKDRVRKWSVETYHIWDSGLENQRMNPYISCDFNLPFPKNISLDPYDMVFCLELFEYIWNPQQAIVNLSYLTSLKGVLYLTVPFLYPVHEPSDADYLRYTANGIARLLGENGFKIQEIIPRIMTPRGFELWKQFIKAEGMHSSKHSRHDILGYIIKAQKG